MDEIQTGAQEATQETPEAPQTGETTAEELLQYALTRDGDDVGMLACYPDTCGAQVEALTAAGFLAEELHAQAEGSATQDADGE